MPDKPTNTQLKTVEYLRDYVDEHGRAPTQERIADYFDVTQQTISERLRWMRDKGMIDYEPRHFCDTLEITADRQG